jgi:hypothetical protein
MVDEFLARYSSAQLSELMAYYRIEHEDEGYRRRDLDPELAQEKLAQMEDEGNDSLMEEIERMEHADFFRDIIGAGKRK